VVSVGIPLSCIVFARKYIFSSERFPNLSALDRDDRKSSNVGQNEEIQGEWTVEKVVDGMPGGPPQTDSSSPVPFFHMLERLKTTKREGWRRFGIDQ
jgi:hypothetical protein